jgi:putative membrane protein
MRLFVRFLITAVAIGAAAWLVPGISITGNGWVAVGVMAIALGLVNAFIRPILKFLSCGLIVLTLGLFTFVVNGAAFWLAGYFASGLGVGFHVAGLWPAIWGSVVVSIVSFLLSVFVHDRDEDRG